MEGGRREKYNLKFKTRYSVCSTLLHEILFRGVILTGKYSDPFRPVDLLLLIMQIVNVMCNSCSASDTTYHSGLFFLEGIHSSLFNVSFKSLNLLISCFGENVA